ncbi:MAG: metal ABC transporter permease, partial [Planctomycetota bacterium]|nr:metal ABC transporter permease [Planctomycetota bacterium]
MKGKNRRATATIETLGELIVRLLPWEWGGFSFLKRAAAAAILIAPACAAMGVNVVSFRLAFFSDAISHSAFAGVAIGLLAGVDPRLTVAAFGLMVGAAIISARRWSDAPTDTAVGVAMAGVVALGIAFVSARGGLRNAMHSFLYGDLLTAGDFETGIAAILLIVSLVFSALTYNRLLLISFDRNLARAAGVRERT